MYPESKIRVLLKQSSGTKTNTVDRITVGEACDLPVDLAKKLILNGSAVLDVSSISVEKLLKFFATDFEKYFDREKILTNLKIKAENFASTISEKMKCPKCDVTLISKINLKDFSVNDFCPICKNSSKKNFIPSQFPDWIISSIMHNFFQGKKPAEIQESLKNELTNRYHDFNGILKKDKMIKINELRIPKKGTLYDIQDRAVKKLRLFNDFMILLIGGINCRELFVDDAFARKTMTSYSKNQWINSNKKERKKLFQKRFFYVIISIDKTTRFIITIYVAEKRDKLNFIEFFRETRAVLRTNPNIIIGDRLSAMIQAARIVMPTKKTIHNFKKLQPWEKGERNIYERRIRDLRKTLPKLRKYSEKKVLKNLTIIAQIGQNYLNPMKKALDSKTPAQSIGIPYPFDSCKETEKGMASFTWNWRLFLEWVKYVFDNVEDILRAGTK